MKVATEKIRERLAVLMQQATECPMCSDEIKELAKQWLSAAWSAPMAIWATYTYPYVEAIRPRSFLRIRLPADANLAIAPIGVAFDVEDFLTGEVRYATVKKQYPAEAEELFAAAKQNAQWRYNNYLCLCKRHLQEEEQSHRSVSESYSRSDCRTGNSLRCTAGI